MSHFKKNGWNICRVWQILNLSVPLKLVQSRTNILLACTGKNREKISGNFCICPIIYSPILGKKIRTFWEKNDIFPWFLPSVLKYHYISLSPNTAILLRAKLKYIYVVLGWECDVINSAVLYLDSGCFPVLNIAQHVSHVLFDQKQKSQKKKLKAQIHCPFFNKQYSVFWCNSTVGLAIEHLQVKSHTHTHRTLQ